MDHLHIWKNEQLQFIHMAPMVLSCIATYLCIYKYINQYVVDCSGGNIVVTA